jgi:hypothetical protein
MSDVFPIEWKEGNPGSYQGSLSSATMCHPGMSHSQSAPPAINRCPSLVGPPGYNISGAPPVPPLPQLFQMPRADSRASATSSQNTSAFLTPQPSPPRSPLSKRVSIDEEIAGSDLEVDTALEPEKLEQLEEPPRQAPLLPNSAFTDPNGELESTKIESTRTSASVPDSQAPPTPSLDVIAKGRPDNVDPARGAATPTAS